ncbi:STE20-related kinase adapter protein alpha-like isoform X2 [Dendronephthya gigantea]|nr:STE20-related kinase adapter protein alpha-like isoform X2 [Dendronephthya gigantea]
MRHEVHLSRLLAHPNILPNLGAFVCGNELWTVSPFMQYGSCDTIMATGFPQGLPEAAIAHILRDVLKALENIHKMGYIHRAVKGSHILIDENGTVQLTGLRESHCLSPNGYNHCLAYDFPLHAVASLPWLAPEVLEQNILGYDYRSDIYSVGITAVELALGVVPYKNMSATQVLLAKLQESDITLQSFSETSLSPCVTSSGVSDSGFGDGIAVSSIEQQGQGKARNKKFSSFFCQFVNTCLQKEPDHRPSASILLNHSFFKHAKKKVKESLPDLLLPVQPTIFDDSEIKNITVVESVADTLDDLTIETWDF